MAEDYEITVESLTADAVKQEALNLGLDLVGIADADVISEHPPPGSNETTPDDLVYGAASIVVVARGVTAGESSLEWDNRNAHHSKQIGLSQLELDTLDLLYFIEDHGHPSIMVPAETARSKLYDGMDDGPLSLPHVAVEAGLGTLGLNLQLLTPEFGPRVILGAIVTTADIEPDERLEEGLCKGAECGRCLMACPGDAIDHFEMRVEDCRPHAQPWGFDRLLEQAEHVMDADSMEEMQNRMTSPETFMIWQSMLHGTGADTGCTRCNDVCPVGEDYDDIADYQSDIPEATDEKRERLANLRRAEIEGNLPPSFEEHRRWIGNIKMDYSDRDISNLEFEFEA